MLLDEGACYEMMEHFALMRKIEQKFGKHICKKLLIKKMIGMKLLMQILFRDQLKEC